MSNTRIGIQVGRISPQVLYLESDKVNVLVENESTREVRFPTQADVAAVLAFLDEARSLGHREFRALNVDERNRSVFLNGEMVRSSGLIVPIDTPIVSAEQMV